MSMARFGVARCDRCHSDTLFSPRDLVTHQNCRNCRGDVAARDLLLLGLVPFPSGHSLPEWFPTLEAQTRVVEGKGYYITMSGSLLVLAGGLRQQYWVPRWVRILTEAFSSWCSGFSCSAELRPEDAEALSAIQLLGGSQTSFRYMLRNERVLRPLWEREELRDRILAQVVMSPIVREYGEYGAEAHHQRMWELCSPWLKEDPR